MVSRQDLADPISEPFVRGFQSDSLAAPVPDRFSTNWSARASGRQPTSGAPPSPASAPCPPTPAITAPTLLLWGDQDALVPRTEQDTLLAAIPGSRLVVYNGAGHSPNWEEPKRVARDIETFLRQPAAEPSPAR